MGFGETKIIDPLALMPPRHMTSENADRTYFLGFSTVRRKNGRIQPAAWCMHHPGSSMRYVTGYGYTVGASGL